MPTAANKHTIRIGPQLRALRSVKRLSLRALAKQTGFSPSFLSQVELEQVSPSLVSLDRIAGCLGVSLPELLSPPEETSRPVIMQRKGEPGVRSEWSRATARSLLPTGGDDEVSVVLVAIEPGGRTGTAARPKANRELAFCVRGRLTLLLNGEHYTLGSGDSIVYGATQPVVWMNRTARLAELLLVTQRIAAGERLATIARPEAVP